MSIRETLLVLAALSLVGHVSSDAPPASAGEVDYGRTIRASPTTGLRAPLTYWGASSASRRTVARHFYRTLGRNVPDQVYGLSIRPSMEILAWMYCEGVDKQIGDDTFERNLIVQIRRAGGLPDLIRARESKAKQLATAVRSKGGRYFARCW